MKNRFAITRIEDNKFIGCFKKYDNAIEVLNDFVNKDYKNCCFKENKYSIRDLYAEKMQDDENLFDKEITLKELYSRIEKIAKGLYETKVYYHQRNSVTLEVYIPFIEWRVNSRQGYFDELLTINYSLIKKDDDKNKTTIKVRDMYINMYDRKYYNIKNYIEKSFWA